MFGLQGVPQKTWAILFLWFSLEFNFLSIIFDHLYVYFAFYLNLTQYHIRVTFDGTPCLLINLSGKCWDSGDAASQNERMDVVGALVSVHSLQVHDMPYDMIFIRDTVSTQHIPALTCNVQGFAAIISLQK